MLIIAAIVIIAVLVGIIIYLLLLRNEEPNDRRNVVVTPENVESVLEDLEGAPEAGYYTVTMNPTWHFGAGEDVFYDAVVEQVHPIANSRKGYWRTAQMLRVALINKIIAKLGYISMLDYYLRVS